jgi:hypothetical protein
LLAREDAAEVRSGASLTSHVLPSHAVDLTLYQLANTSGTIIILGNVDLLEAEVRQN